jgi:O-antigen/teichoic acid export membrane protein
MEMTNRNILYNYVSFLIIGASGILLNIFILSAYDILVLGDFNFSLTFLMILSQFCVGGVQFSILKHNSIFHKKISEVSKSLISALLLSTITSLSIISILYFTAPLLEHLFNLDNFLLSIYLISPALLFFALNKILLMSLNGLNLMREYAVLNTLRYIILFVSILGFYFIKIDTKYIAGTLTISELILFIILLSFTYKKILIFKLPKSYWIKRHFYFGVKGMWGGALMETNTRVDILMIGAILGYGAVGIYSFASMIAEGFAQVYTVLKNNVDPVFGNAFFNKNYSLITKTITDIRKKYTPFIFLFGLLIITLYKPIFIHIFGLEKNMIESSWSVITILITFMMMASFYKPFMGLLNQINQPALFSKIILFSVILNIILNSFLIPQFGIQGASISTGMIFFIESYLLYISALAKIN